MTQILGPIYVNDALRQRPYLNVFKEFSVETGSSEVEFRGAVESVLDPVIQKRVWQLSGPVPVATHLRIPGDRARDLRLMGRFLYLQVRLDPTKNFVIHIDCVARYSAPIAGPQLNREVISLQSSSNLLERPVRISASNMYRKYEEGAAAKGELRVQVPVSVHPQGGWHVLALDLRKLTADYSRDGLRFDHIRSITVCAHLAVRNMFTSDSKYSLLGVPPEMALSLKPEVAAEVTCRWLPEEPVDVTFAPPHPASTARKAALSEATTGRLPHRLQALMDGDRGLPMSPARDLLNTPQPPLPSSPSRPFPSSVSRVHAEDSEGEELEGSLALDRTALSDIERLEEAALERSLVTPPGSAPASPLQPTRTPHGRRLHLDPRSDRGPATADRFAEPEPLADRLGSVRPLASAPSAALQQAVGFSGADSAPSSRRLLVADPLSDQGRCGPDREVVFASHHLIVAMKTGPKRTQEAPAPQRFFRGHVRRVTSLALSGNGKVLGSAEEPSHLGVPSLRVWDFASGRCLAILGMREADRPVHVTSLDLSKDGARLVALGASNVDETVMCLWDLSAVLSGAATSARLVARQVVDADARVVRFCPFQEDEVVVGGRNTLRVHRLYRGSEWRGMSVALAPKDEALLTELAKSALVPNTFTAIAFDENEPDASVGLAAYVATVTGHVFKVDVSQRRLLSIFHLHNGAINALDIRGGLCVTGGDDRVVRVWPLDFNDFLMEAEHEAAIGDLAFSPDALSVCVGTEDGCIGQLTVQDRGYEMALRAHSGPVLEVAAAPDLSRAVSVSADGTIRSWLLPGLQQDGEFVADPNDTPLSVDLCCLDLEAAQTNAPETVPLLPPVGGKGRGTWVAAVGFSSGVMRVFELQKNLLLTETRQHRAPVTRVQFTPGGRWLFTADSEGALCVYQPHRGFLPLKYLNAGKASGPEDKGTLLGGEAGALLPRYPLAVSKDGSLMCCVVADREARPCLVMFALQPTSIRAVFKVDLHAPVEEAHPEGKKVAPPPPRTSPVTAMAFNGLGTAVLLGRADGSVERYDASSGSLEARAVHPLDPQSLGCASVASDLWDRLLVTSGNMGDVRLWDARSLAHYASISVAPDGAASVALLVDPRGAALQAPSLLVGTSDGSLQLWALDPAAQLLEGLDPLRSSLLANRALAVEAGLSVGAASPSPVSLRPGPSAEDEALQSSTDDAAGETFGPKPQLQVLYGGSAVGGAAFPSSCWSEARGALAYCSGRLLIVEEFYRNPSVMQGAALPVSIQRVQRCLTCEGDVTAITWGRDGTVLAVGLASGAAQVWTSPSPSESWVLRATLAPPQVRSATPVSPPVQSVTLDRSCTWLLSCTASSLAVFDLLTGSHALALNAKSHPRQLHGLHGAVFLEPAPTALTPRASLSLVTFASAGCTLFALSSDSALSVWPLWSYGIAVAKGLVEMASVEPSDRAMQRDETGPSVDVREVRVERDQGQAVSVRLLTASGHEVRVLLPEGASTEPRVAAIRPHAPAEKFTLHPVPQKALFDSILPSTVCWAEMRGRRAVLGCVDGSCHLVDLDALDAWRAQRDRLKEKRAGTAAPNPRGEEGEGQEPDRLVSSLRAGAPTVCLLAPLRHRVTSLSAPEGDQGGFVAAVDEAGACVMLAHSPAGTLVPVLDLTAETAALPPTSTKAGKGSHTGPESPVSAACVLGSESLVGLIRRNGSLEGYNLEYLAGSADYEVMQHHGREIRAVGPMECSLRPSSEGAQNVEDGPSTSATAKYFVTVDDSGSIVFSVARKGIKWGQVEVGRSVKTARLLSIPGQGSLALLHTSAPEDAPLGEGAPDRWIEASLSPRRLGGVVERLELWRLSRDDAADEFRGLRVASFTLPEGTVVADLALIATPQVRVAFIDASLGAAVYWTVPLQPEACYAGEFKPAKTQPPVIYIQAPSGQEFTAVGLASGSTRRGPCLVLGTADGSLLSVDELSLVRLTCGQGTDVVSLSPLAEPDAAGKRPTVCSVGDWVQAICVCSSTQAIVSAGKGLALVKL